MSCAQNCGACHFCLAMSQQGALQSQNSLHQQSLGQAQGLAQQGQQYLNQAQVAQQNHINARLASIASGMAYPTMGVTGISGSYDPDYVNTRPYIDTDFSLVDDPEATDCQCAEKMLDAMDKLESSEE